MNNTQQYHTLDFTQYTDLIDYALSEDLGGQIDLQNDITSSWTLESDTRARANIVARTAGVIAGLVLVAGHLGNIRALSRREDEPETLG